MYLKKKKEETEGKKHEMYTDLNVPLLDNLWKLWNFILWVSFGKFDMNKRIFSARIKSLKPPFKYNKHTFNNNNNNIIKLVILCISSQVFENSILHNVISHDIEKESSMP